MFYRNAKYENRIRLKCKKPGILDGVQRNSGALSKLLSLYCQLLRSFQDDKITEAYPRLLYFARTQLFNFLTL